MMGETLSDWVLQHYGQEQFHPGLERIGQALRPLLPAFSETKIITIAGTNGKGETTLRLSHLLGEEAHCAWTSPHIERITERFRSEEGEIEEARLWEIALKCHASVQKEKYQLSYYEFLFFVFCTWAHERSPKFLLLEVGLGGRLDAVNVFNADLVLLPSISRDHQEILGNRYDLILREKLGVLRPGSTLISFLCLKYLRERAEAFCLQIGADWIDLEEVKAIKDFQFSARNQFLAHAAYLFLTGITESQIFSSEYHQNWLPEEKGLEHRGEIIESQGIWHFFGSHNLDGMRKLIQFLKSENYNLSKPFDVIIIAFSRRDRRDLSLMLKMIKASGLGDIKVTVFNHPKAALRDEMKSLTQLEGLHFVEDIESFVQGQNTGHILVAGSYYFLGHIKSLLRR
jgi:dihydrofolate synthase/folylpolyglutamate synthase